MNQHAPRRAGLVVDFAPLTSQLSSWWRRARSGRRGALRRHPATLPRQAYRPVVELLEDRLPPGEMVGALWTLPAADASPDVTSNAPYPTSDYILHRDAAAQGPYRPPTAQPDAVTGPAYNLFVGSRQERGEEPAAPQAQAGPADEAQDAATQHQSPLTLNADSLFASASWLDPRSAGGA